MGRKKKEERKEKYWKGVKADFKPRPSERKIAEREIQLMRHQHAAKKRFNFVNLNRIALDPDNSAA